MMRFHPFLPSMVLFLLPTCVSLTMAGLRAPYPPTKTITKLKWEPDVVKLEGCLSGDNWPIAWLDDNHWSVQNGKDCRTYHHRFPPKWISADCKTMWLLSSGLDCGLYSFCVKKATLDVADVNSPDTRAEAGVTRTFSIVAVDPDSGVCGAAVASKYPAVGKIVPYVRAGVGAFCTQHWHNPKWGELALDLLAKDNPPEQVLSELLRNDAQREKRQLALIDMSGRVANHNPAKADPSGIWWGTVSGKYYSCQGNTLVGREVVFAMARAYEETKGRLADRLMAALIAGDCAGGDHRGRLAAGIRVAKEGIDGSWLELYVDKSDDAVIDLAKKYAALNHEAKGTWRGGRLPFAHPCPDQAKSSSNIKQ